MQNKNLVIIGNGFDLAHGLNTKWSDFEDFLNEHDTALFDQLSDCSNAELWSDFEKELGNIDLRRLYTNELYGFDMIENDEDEGRNHQMADQIRFVEDNIIDGLKRNLNEWILTIELDAEPYENLKCIFKCADVISFNYTSTLECVYKIPHERIVYLHGKAKSPSFCEKGEFSRQPSVPEIVVGHGRIVEPVDIGSFANSMSDSIVLDEVESEGHRDILQELRKDTSQYMDRLNLFFNSMNSYGRVYIVGHSLSEVDAPYFNELASRLKQETQIFVSYDPERENREDKKKKVRDFFPLNEIVVKEIDKL